MDKECYIWETMEIDRLNNMIKNGADVNVKYENNITPLHLVAQKHFELDVIKALVKAGADVNAKDSKGRTPLHWAAKCNKEISADETCRTADILLDAGADVHKQDIDGNTPIHLAAMYNTNHLVLKLLLDVDGAKKYLLGDDGESLLELAKDKKNHPMVIDTLKNAIKNAIKNATV